MLMTPKSAVANSQPCYSHIHHVPTVESLFSIKASKTNFFYSLNCISLIYHGHFYSSFSFIPHFSPSGLKKKNSVWKIKRNIFPKKGRDLIWLTILFNIFNLQVRELMYKEVKWLAQANSFCWSWVKNVGLLHCSSHTIPYCFSQNKAITHHGFSLGQSYFQTLCLTLSINYWNILDLPICIMKSTFLAPWSGTKIICQSML